MLQRMLAIPIDDRHYGSALRFATAAGTSIRLAD